MSFLITLSVSTDSQKRKAENEQPIDEDLVDCTGLMEKLRKRRSTEGVREPDVYDSVHGFAFLSSSNMRSPHGYCDHRENTTLGSQIFFHQQLEARDTQTTVKLSCEW